MGDGSLPATLYVNKIKNLSNLQVHCNVNMDRPKSRVGAFLVAAGRAAKAAIGKYPYLGNC